MLYASVVHDEMVSVSPELSCSYLSCSLFKERFGRVDVELLWFTEILGLCQVLATFNR